MSAEAYANRTSSAALTRERIEQAIARVGHRGLDAVASAAGCTTAEAAKAWKRMEEINYEPMTKGKSA